MKELQQKLEQPLNATELTQVAQQLSNVQLLQDYNDQLVDSNVVGGLLKSVQNSMAESE